VALGAAPRQILIPVIREGLMLALLGIGLGLIGAFAAMRALTAFLFGVGAERPAHLHRRRAPAAGRRDRRELHPVTPRAESRSGGGVTGGIETRR